MTTFRIFQLNDRLGNGGLGYVEAVSRVSHATGFDNGQQNIEVSQFETPQALF